MGGQSSRRGRGSSLTSKASCPPQRGMARPNLPASLASTVVRLLNGVFVFTLGKGFAIIGEAGRAAKQNSGKAVGPPVHSKSRQSSLGAYGNCRERENKERRGLGVEHDHFVFWRPDLLAQIFRGSSNHESRQDDCNRSCHDHAVETAAQPSKKSILRAACSPAAPCRPVSCSCRAWSCKTR